MSISINVDADEVIRALDKLDKKASVKAVKGAVRKGGQFLKPKIKAAAPKGKTGNLRKKVGVRVKKSRRHADSYYAAVRSFAPHHHLVVEGTMPRYARSGGYRGRMPSNPYVDRVSSQFGEEALRIAEDDLIRQLDLD